MLKAMEAELDNRRKGEAVRLEVTQGCPLSIRNQLLSELELGKQTLTPSLDLSMRHN